LLSLVVVGLVVIHDQEVVVLGDIAPLLALVAVVHLLKPN